ncbi:CoA transferase [Sediminivirga luteola]|uniref:CoA transferase n=1 Tax=Sediminivirga luteola TaxID=1774748 RepID=UPI001F57A028|nr:CoA transferase [Sediminivirga luteola]MCI2265108.1 CoA transferase [Sediminivirga luteola]
MTVGHFAARAWAAAGGDPAMLHRLGSPAAPVPLCSRLDAAGLLAGTMGAASLAFAALAVSGGPAARAAPAATASAPAGLEGPWVRLDGRRIAASARSDRLFRLDGQPPRAWAPLSGFWPAADGWVRTHANYPHHEERLRALLGIGPGAADETATAGVAEVIGAHSARELEDRAAAAGAVVVAVRGPEEWAAHPQGRAVAAEPLIGVREIGGAVPGRKPPGAAAGDLPLRGVRVLDLTRVIAGPVATRALAFAGAEVLRVDPPHLPEAAWQHLDTGQEKRSTLLDLRSPEGRRKFEELLADADVLVTGYRPGALGAFGLSTEELAARHPGLVVGRVSAWGHTGPWADRRGFDSIVQAASGIAVIEGVAAGEDVRPGALPAQALDHAAGHLLATALTLAVAARREDGRGRAVSVSLARVAAELMAAPAPDEAGSRALASYGPRNTACPASASSTGAPASASAAGSQTGGGRRDGRGSGAPGEQEEAPTVTGRTPAGVLVCAAPALDFPGAPSGYAHMGGLWGADAPAWRADARP